ncbi:TIGR04104 family putative zinc finger protein [Pseudobacillus sp. 179-B 2D1 NHS]|uniref:TIGR04104 family putative zinc finger protein n=1 Tax=unclassified Pseudobacillus TaxID=2619284 RepID=UPI00387911C8
MLNINLQKCETCHRRFKWTEIYPSLFIESRALYCKQCQTHYTMIHSSRLTYSALCVLIAILLCYFTIYRYHLSWPSIFVYLLLMTLTSFLFPLCAKYQRSQETEEKSINTTR